MRRVQAVTAEGCATIMMIAITAMISTTVAITIMISMRAFPFSMRRLLQQIIREYGRTPRRSLVAESLR